VAGTRRRVLIRPKEGILDPQGQTVERALPALGFDGVSDVRVGRMVELNVEDESRLPEICNALAAERFWKRLPFARPPEVSVMEPDQIRTISDDTKLLVDQQDVTPLGLAYQAIELQTTEAPLDVALRRVLRAMKV